MRIMGIGQQGQMTRALAAARLESDMRSEVESLAAEASMLIDSFSGEGMVKTASSDDILSKLADKFKVKVELIKRGKKNRSRKGKKGMDIRVGTSDMVSFPAVANNNDPEYVCSVKIQKPQDNIIAVSVCLMETAIGQCAYKNHFFFKPGNEDLAKRCYRRVSLAIKDVREDVASGHNLQHEVALMIAKRLQGEESEVQQEVKQFAVYLDPRNVGRTDAGKHNFPSIRETSSQLKTK
jgi:uncharacterized protein (DUF2147 family)